MTLSFRPPIFGLALLLAACDQSTPAQKTETPAPAPVAEEHHIGGTLIENGAARDLDGHGNPRDDLRGTAEADRIIQQRIDAENERNELLARQAAAEEARLRVQELQLQAEQERVRAVQEQNRVIDEQNAALQQQAREAQRHQQMIDDQAAIIEQQRQLIEQQQYQNRFNGVPVIVSRPPRHRPDGPHDRPTPGNVAPAPGTQTAVVPPVYQPPGPVAPVVPNLTPPGPPGSLLDKPETRSPERRRKSPTSEPDGN